MFFSGCINNKFTSKENIKNNAMLSIASLEKDTKDKTQQGNIENKYVQEEKKSKVKIKRKRNKNNNGALEFTETGVGIASKYERIIEAEKRAEKNAIEKVLKKTGMNVYYGFQDVLAQYGKTPYQFVSNYIYTWTSAIIDYERVGNPVYISKPSGITECCLTIKGKIYKSGEPDPSFEIRTDLKAEKLGLNQPSYFDGDMVIIRFWVTEDCYVHLLVVDEEQNVTLLYPNTYVSSNMIKAGKIFEFPSQDDKFNLRAFLPEGKNETIEFIHIIATKNKPLFSVSDTKEKKVGAYRQMQLGEVSLIAKRLSKLGRSQWTMKILPYTIKKR